MMPFCLNRHFEHFISDHLDCFSSCSSKVSLVTSIMLHPSQKYSFDHNVSSNLKFHSVARDDGQVLCLELNYVTIELKSILLK